MVPALLVALGLAACSGSGGSSSPAPPTATAEAVGTLARQRADANVRRILAGDRTATPSPSPTPAPGASCPGGAAMWWYEARTHVGELVTIEGPVVRVRQLEGGRGVLEIGQFYPDPTGVNVVVGVPLAEQTFNNATVCVSGTLVATDSGAAMQVGGLDAIRVVAAAE